MKEKHLLLIDPAVKIPELATFNWISLRAGIPATYHLPAMHGMKSLQAETDGIAGIVVLGSLASVNERTEWQEKLEAWLMPWLGKSIPTLGICYGHQMLAFMFGGEVDYLHPSQKKQVGLRQVSLEADSLWGNQPISGSICVSHNEVVTKIPAAMRSVGKSDLVPVDALKHNQLPIWSFQSHPEAGSDFLKTRGLPVELSSELNFGYSLIDFFLELVRKNSK